MRRFLISFLVLGLMAGSVATAEANKKRNRPPKLEPTRIERTVEVSYGPYPAPVTGCNSALGSFACAIIPTQPHEAFFTAKVTDAHGQPVFVQVRAGGRKTHFCGETKEPIRFQPSAELYFFVALPNWGIQTDCPAHSIKTTGTISVTLSNLPPTRPLRSGTIVSGTVLSSNTWVSDNLVPENHAGACQMSPDCRAWLESDCNPALANRDPAAMASIVGVGNLADGSTPRVFEYEYAKPVGLSWGEIGIQFWGQDCTQIRGSLWRYWEEAKHRDSQRGEIPFVPVSAEWMTVSSTLDNARIAWTLA